MKTLHIQLSANSTKEKLLHVPLKKKNKSIELSF